MARIAWILMSFGPNRSHRHKLKFEKKLNEHRHHRGIVVVVVVVVVVVILSVVVAVVVADFP